MRLLLVHDDVPKDARPDELDTLAQAEAFVAALRTLGHDVEALAIGLDLGPLDARLRDDPPDVVFNVMESLGGHTRLLATVPRLVETRRVPLAGCSAEGIHRSSWKVHAKAALRAAGLPTPPSRTLEELRAGHGLAGPVILKSVWEHASVGLDDRSVLGPGVDAVALARELEARLPALGGEGFAEAFVDGREFVVGLLPPGPDEDPREPVVLPPSELEFLDWPAGKPRLIGFACKWDFDSLEYARTERRVEFAPHDGPLLAELEALAAEAWRCFDLRGHARVDFRIDAAGRPWILEVNANPCVTPDAGFVTMLTKAGIPYEAMVARLVEAALARPRVDVAV